MAKKKDRTHCTQPDRDVPGIVCGHPLPCPWHTAIVEDGAVTMHHEAREALRQLGRLLDIARAMEDV